MPLSQSGQYIPTKGNNVEPPTLATGVVPVLAFGASWDPVKQVWTRDLGDEDGKKVYSDDLAAYMQAMIMLLNQIKSCLPPLDGTNTRLRATVEAMVANITVSVSQVNAVAALAGIGASGTGTLRVTPANDTIAGIPHIQAFQNAFGNIAFGSAFYDRVTT